VGFLSNMYWAYVEFGLLLLIASRRSLKRVRNAVPVCPTYFRVQSLHLFDEFRCYRKYLLSFLF
jgi:hypothetical protein